MAADAPETESLSVVLASLVQRLHSDEAGREVLRSLVEGQTPPDELSRLLADRGSPTIATFVSGGVVDKIVNIAHADVVQLAPVPTAQRPAQLPNDLRDFTDRTGAIEEMLTTVQTTQATDSRATIVCVFGVGGAGKSALAIHVGHLLRESHVDAQLYVNLRGAETVSLDPTDVLDGFLRALGLEGSRIPPAVGDRAGMYRAALAGQRAVVLLDNAASESQVRPLLPGGPRNVVIVTSRRPLAALEGAVAISLDVLAPEQGLALLTNIVGQTRVGAEPDAARDVVALCGALPLAIRVAGAKLTAKPHWGLERLASRLRDERHRLAELSVGDLDVGGTFMLSYRGLEPDLQRAFRFASQVLAPDFASWTLAALLDSDPDSAGEWAESLVETQLFEVAGEDATGEIRYRLHDLLRVFGRERMEEVESQAERRSAVERSLGALLALAKRGLFLLSPHSQLDQVPSKTTLWPVPGDLAERLQRHPLDWFAAEYPALIAGIREAHQRQLWEHTWELADSMHYYFRVRSLWKDWQQTHELALDAAQRAGNLRGEAWTLRNLGNAHRDRYQAGDAADCFTRSLEIFRRLDNRLGQAAALTNLGELALDNGRLAEASAYFEQCLPAWAEVGDQIGVAYVTLHLGLTCRQQGRWAEARTRFDRSLAMFRDLGDRFGTAHGMHGVGDLLIDEGRHDDASEVLEESERMFADLGDRVGGASALVSLARLRLEQGHRPVASEMLSRAMETFREFGDRRGVTWALLVFGDACRIDGRYVVAAAAFEEAVAAFENWGQALGEGIAHYGLGRVHLVEHDAGLAAASFRAAVGLFRDVGAAGWQAKAERQLAEATSE